MDAFLKAKNNLHKADIHAYLLPYMQEVLSLLHEGFTKHNLYNAFDIERFIKEYMFTDSEITPKLSISFDKMKSKNTGGVYRHRQNEIRIADYYAQTCEDLQETNTLSTEILHTLMHEFVHFLTSCGEINYKPDTNSDKTLKVITSSDLERIYFHHFGADIYSPDQLERFKMFQKNLETDTVKINDYSTMFNRVLEEALTEKFSQKMLSQKYKPRTSYSEFVNVLSMYEHAFDITESDLSFLRRENNIYVKKSYPFTFAMFSIVLKIAFDEYNGSTSYFVERQIATAESEILKTFISYLHITKDKLSMTDFINKIDKLISFSHNSNSKGYNSVINQAIEVYADHMINKNSLYHNQENNKRISNFIIKLLAIKQTMKLEEQLKVDNIYCQKLKHNTVGIALKNNNLRLYDISLTDKNDNFYIPIQDDTNLHTTYEYKGTSYLVDNLGNNKFSIKIMAPNKAYDYIDVEFNDSKLTLQTHNKKISYTATHNKKQTTLNNTEKNFKNLVKDIKERDRKIFAKNILQNQLDSQPLMLK